MKPNYQDRYRDQIREAAQRTLGSAGQGASSRRSASRLAVLSVLTAGFLATGTAAALTVAKYDPDDPNDPAPTSPRVISNKATPLSRDDLATIKKARQQRAPVLDASRYFSVLKAPARSRDAVTTRNAAATGLAKRTRLAYDGPGGRVYIRATDREVCIYTFAGAGRSFSSGCNPTAYASKYGTFITQECIKTPPQKRVLSGIAPDGVTSVEAYRDGRLQATAQVQRNGFVLKTDEPIDEVRIGRSTRHLPPVTC